MTTSIEMRPNRAKSFASLKTRSPVMALLSPSSGQLGYSTDRTQLNLRYDHHHQQPQQQGHYDKLDPFRRSVREPAQHLVEATHGQPPAIKQVLRNNNAMGERQQPTNSGLRATHLALRRPEALGEAAGALSGVGGWR